MAKNLLDLSGKVVLVTGASSGIGAHLAPVIAEAGAAVALAARRTDRLQELVDKIRADNGKKNEDKVDNLDEAVQAIHSSSENHKEAETRKWFAVLEKTAMIVSKSF